MGRSGEVGHTATGLCQEEQSTMQGAAGADESVSSCREWEWAKSLKGGMVQIAFLVDPRFLEVARAQKAALEQSARCALRISEQHIGQVIVSGLRGRAREAVSTVRHPTRVAARAGSDAQARRSPRSAHTSGSAAAVSPPGGSGARELMCSPTCGACGHSDRSLATGGS